MHFDCSAFLQKAAGDSCTQKGEQGPLKHGVIAGRKVAKRAAFGKVGLLRLRSSKNSPMM